MLLRLFDCAPSFVLLLAISHSNKLPHKISTLELSLF